MTGRIPIGPVARLDAIALIGRGRYHRGAESRTDQVCCLKAIVLSLLLLTGPLMVVAAEPMVFCGGYGEAAHIAAYQGSSAQQTVDQDTARAVEPSSHDIAVHADDRSGCPDCHCSICGTCCIAAGLPSSGDLLSTVLASTGLRRLVILNPLEGRIPSTLELPPPSPRSTRVVYYDARGGCLRSLPIRDPSTSRATAPRSPAFSAYSNFEDSHATT